MKNILVAVNSFKETADAVQVSELFNKYLDKSIFNVIQKPISDGGDGFLEVCRFHFNLEIIEYTVSSPNNDSYIDCKVGLDNKNKTLYIESAEVIGLKKVPDYERNPLKLNSKGLGELIDLISKDIEELKFDVEKVIIGIGGTATMDMGLGLCSYFGLKLFDVSGNELEVLPENFSKAADIEFDKPDFPFAIELVLDVNNPLLGKDGGILFGPQKGAAKADLQIIESGWRNISNLLKNNYLINSSKPQYGAGGGLQTGFSLLSECKIIPAKDFIINNLRISENINDIDMVITGEGAFDKQSFMGKGAGIIIDLFDEKNIPVALCCGRIDYSISEQLSMNIFPMELITYVDDPVTNFEEAIKIACSEISGMTDILTKFS